MGANCHFIRRLFADKLLANGFVYFKIHVKLCFRNGFIQGPTV